MLDLRHLYASLTLISNSSIVSDLLPRKLLRLWKLRPSEITFSQDSIGRNFSDGNSLDQTYDDLRSGRCKVEDIERIKITWHSHERSFGEARWWTYTGNRRLSLFQKLEAEGGLDFLVAEWVNVPVPEWRMTTFNGGGRPSIRGKKRWCHLWAWPWKVSLSSLLGFASKSVNRGFDITLID